MNAVPPPAQPAGASRYGWFVGLVAVLVIAYISINTATTPSIGSRGVTPGRPLPPFAVPLALSDLQGDADIATRSGQGQAGRRPACSVRGLNILNVCQLAENEPLVLGLFVPAGACARALDEMAALAPSFPGVRFAGVAVRGTRSDVRALLKARNWPFPVGYDRDGALASVYRMALCSEVTLALPGGRVYGPALLGAPAPGVLRTRLAALVAASGGQGRRSR